MSAGRHPHNPAAFAAHPISSMKQSGEIPHDRDRLVYGDATGMHYHSLHPPSKGSVAVCIREARTDAHERPYKRPPVGVRVGVSRSTSLGGYKKAPQPAKPPLSAPGNWP